MLEIDLDAVVENWRTLRAKVAPDVACAAVVKADAYGLGLAPVVQSLAAIGCTLFFVATIEEGLAARRLLPDADIAVLNGLLPGAEAEFAAGRLTPVLNDLGQIDAWRRWASRQGSAHPAMLHIDTGMARLGLDRPGLSTLLEEKDRLEGIALTAILSHLACADTPDHPQNAAQHRAFSKALAAFPGIAASLAASSGVFLGSAYHFAIVRPGAALYGVNPVAPSPNPMRPVVHLKARLLQVRDIDSGESVGYGAAHRMDRVGRIATIAMGYADGWLRSGSHRGSARIGYQRAPLIGRISMDLLTLDVTGIDPALLLPGSFVDLLDEEVGVDAQAQAAGTIGYEILTALGRRHHRVYRGGRWAP
ncbi:MAG TPA: alanine racemase [Stellaceae bacterium]|nr:alanine racemase [Stellaceae bacterium]